LLKEVTMRKLSRRDLVKQLGVAGISPAIARSASGAPQSGLRPEASSLVTEVIPLEGEWQFKLDPDGAGESRNRHLASSEAADWGKVSVPHTWQVSPTSVEYQGVAWYRKTFEAPAQWVEKAVRVEFEAVYHSATVWLNDQPVGEHLRSGYTAFTLDASWALHPGSVNTLVVRVDNSFDDQLLPRGKSFDWTVDGGITRPVSLLISPPTFIERVNVDVDPNLEAKESRLAVRVVLRNAAKNAAEAKVGFVIAEDDTGRTVLRSETGTHVLLEPRSSRAVSLPVAVLASPRLWHFDHPHLYRVGVVMEGEGKPLHSCADTFGIRKFEVKDAGFHLNGEPVHLMGVERMAGSHPDYGMAEPSSWITHDHNDLKELNCVLTRVHWQQDRRVLDYCDRHGILIQEEVPAWGPDTFKGMSRQPSPELLGNGLAQLREMIQRDSNHPSIFAWGLCNEVDGQNPPARAFIQRMAEEARRLDPRRLLTYASHSLYQNPGNDIAGLLDFISFNEYYESWHAGNPETLRENLQQIHAAFPSKPLVISEYGYCECTPERLGGDARRIEILRDHTKVFRELGFVTGAIFFDYNDYRTHMADKGIGALKQRVHGVVDLYGNRKPSFDALRGEASPFEELQVVVTGRWVTAIMATRSTLPAYTLEGYTLRCIVYGFGDLPVEQLLVPLPSLKPGEGIIQEVDFQEKAPKRIRVDIMRPTGFSAKTAWWRGSPESSKG
jgi:beta-galactosidase